MMEHMQTRRSFLATVAGASALVLAACGGSGAGGAAAAGDGADAKGEGVMTHAEYMAAAENDPVVIEAFVQAKQSWWDNKATLYLQDADGAYFVYNAACSEDDYAKLVEGQKVKVTGFKAQWSGEIEIGEGAELEIEDGSFIAAPTDVTELLGTDALIDHQNEKVAFSGLTIEPSTDADGNDAAFLYNWDGSGAAGQNSDLYFNASDGNGTYSFTVESYLTGEDTDVYKAVTELNVGDTVNLEGFLYWYEGANPHITSVTVA